MGRYAESVGVWEHTIGNITHVIKPEELDNYEFIKIRNESQKNDDTELLYRKMGNLYFRMVVRSDPTLTDDDKNELKVWISKNIDQIIGDFAIAFNWTTEDKLNDAKKKLNEASEKKKL